MAMDRSWIEKPRKSLEYAQGILGFIDFALEHRSVNGNIICPCPRCRFKKWQTRDVAYEHLTTKQFPKGYTFWFYHGEIRQDDKVPNVVQDDKVDKDSTKKISNDASVVDINHANEVPFTSNEVNGDGKGVTPNVTQESNEIKESYELEGDAEEPLYEGCAKYSKLSFLLKLYHIKCESGMSDNAMTMILELLKDAFQHAKILGSFHEAKKTIDKLGLNHDKINACSDNCMLYQDNKDDEEKQICTSKAKGGETETLGDDHGNRIDLARVRDFRMQKEAPHDGLHVSSKCTGEGQMSLPPHRSSAKHHFPHTVLHSGDDVGGSSEVLAPASKRARQDVPGSSGSHGAGKGLLCYELKNSQGIELHRDTCETSYWWSRIKDVISEEDQHKLERYSSKQLVEFAAGDFARSLNLIVQLGQRADRYQEEIAQLTKELDHWKDKYTCEESAKLKEICQLTKDRDHWKEMYGREVTTGKKFLKSSTGRTLLASIKEEGVREFKESDSFDATILKKASVIYEQTIRDCRRVLRETGRYPPEDLLLLDPTIPDVVDAGDVN